MLLLSLSSGLAGASPLYVSVSGAFSNTDIAGALVTPNAPFTLRFSVESNPVPVSGTSTTLGFDAPTSGFLYTLSGVRVSASPTEVRFNTTSNGGLFDLTFGTGLSAATFSFQGTQAFSGPTTAPNILLSNLVVTSFTYSDASNYDSPSPTSATASIAPAPEPSSALLILCGIIALIAVQLRKSIVAL